MYRKKEKVNIFDERDYGRDKIEIKYLKWKRKNIVKESKVACAFLLMILAFILSFILYMYSYKLINKIDDTIYYKVASERQYDREVYFSKEADDRSGIVTDTLNQIIDITNSEISRKQDIYKAVAENGNVSIKLINDNSEYIDYLNDYNLTVEDLIKYCSKMAKIDDDISTASFYLTITLVLGIYLCIFGYRKLIYSIAFIVYFFTNIDLFSGGIVREIIFNLNTSLSFEEYNTLINLIIPAIKEACLTLIIIDTINEYFVQNKNRKLKKKLKSSYNSINKLKQDIYENNLSKVDIGFISRDIIFIYKYCIRNSEDIDLGDLELYLEKTILSYPKERIENGFELIRIITRINDILMKSKISSAVIL
ncbi:hypothetical protein [Clostridium sp. LP20]|uniref:hypothetical protein n=1 Tax=Clostridium sp. LP20 TaxID=3418665 RepID=UPI003EE701E4